MVKDTISAITQSTPVSIALALSIFGGASVCGIAVGKFTASLENNTKVLEKLSEIATDNKRRLDILETKIGK